jgi:hypothetical protein
VNQSLKKILYGIILTIGLIWLINYYFNFEIKKSELKEVTGFLQNDPMFDTGAKGHWFMELELMEDQYRYQTDGLSYKALDIKGVKQDLKAGTPIKLLVAKEIGFEETVNRFTDIIRIYSLSSGDKIYLKLEDYNNGKKSNRYFFPILWIILFGIYIYSFWIKNKRTITAA